MTQFLINLVEKRTNSQDSKYREKFGYLGSIVGILVNVTLFAIKLSVGLIVKSISVTADAFNNLSDTLSSIITLLGFKLASQPPDEDHPYGHGRIEYFSGLIVSILVLYVGIQFLISSVKKIINPEELKFQWIPVILYLVSIVLKIWLSGFNGKLGNKINSSALKAAALDAKGDVMISITVVVGLLLSHFTGFNLDGFFGLFVAFMIIKSAIELIGETINPLLGEKQDEDLVKNIEEIILSFDEIYGIHDTVVHNYGPNMHIASTHVEVRDNISIVEIHDIIDSAEKKVKESLGVEVVCHMDPIRIDDPEAINMLKKIKEIITEQSGILDVHDMRFREDNFYADVVLDRKFLQNDMDIDSTLKKAVDKIKEVYPNICPNLNIDFKNIVATIE